MHRLSAGPYVTRTLQCTGRKNIVGLFGHGDEGALVVSASIDVDSKLANLEAESLRAFSAASAAFETKDHRAEQTQKC